MGVAQLVEVRRRLARAGGRGGRVEGRQQLVPGKGNKVRESGARQARARLGAVARPDRRARVGVAGPDSRARPGGGAGRAAAQVEIQRTALPPVTSSAP